MIGFFCGHTMSRMNDFESRKNVKIEIVSGLCKYSKFSLVLPAWCSMPNICSQSVFVPPAVFLSSIAMTTSQDQSINWRYTDVNQSCQLIKMQVGTNHGVAVLLHVYIQIFVGLEGKNTITLPSRCFYTGEHMLGAELVLELIKLLPAVSVNYFICLNDSLCPFFVLEPIERASGSAPSTRCCLKVRVWRSAKAIIQSQTCWTEPFNLELLF